MGEALKRDLQVHVLLLALPSKEPALNLLPKLEILLANKRVSKTNNLGLASALVLAELQPEGLVEQLSRGLGFGVCVRMISD